MASKGQGWYGDSEGHKRAGRKGGRARGNRSQGSQSGEISSDNNSEGVTQSSE